MDSIKNLKETLEKCQRDELFIQNTEHIKSTLAETIQKRKQVFIAGNGGSAGEAQHFAAELVGRYKLKRPGYPSIALTTDTSTITAIANDYGYDTIFSRQLEALAEAGDILIILSTSGNSTNCIKAIEKAREIKMRTIALLGKDGGKIRGIAEHEIIVPSDDTARIQEIHLLLIHTFCEYVEQYII